MGHNTPERGIKISDFTDVGKLKALMENLHDITGVPACILTRDGVQVATTRGWSFCTESCRLCAGGPALSCCDSGRVLGLKGGESVMVRCRGSSRMIVAPVCLEGRPVAFFCGGPLSCPDEREMPASPAAVPLLSPENVSRVLSLASTFAGMLSMCITHSFQLVREMEGRKLAENRLHDSEGLYRTIFEHSGTAMAIVRDDGSIVRANLGFGNLLKIDQNVLCGIPWTLFVSPEERERILVIHEKRDLDPLFSMNGYEIALTSVDGRQISAVLHTGKIPGNDCYVLSLLDVTERRRLEEMREEAFAQIDRNFAQLAVLNDRIRNPLTAIVGLAGMAEGAFSEKILRHAMEIDDIVTHLDERWLECETVRGFLRRHYGTEGGRSGSPSASEDKNKFIP
ncbi:MAG: PocR ligand-binding domain-containing protein [Methanofollis sp.]|uniref:PocR ligand-binding domain-containing protein n=1 Tax=Methanofollis sp. TaxID=2052835 RepID=UPI002606400F|nr:PocR ligand-binding domain-containing protein [Methanofollis sp.]MDD4254145.1 PocR ligand-binding domain-containing protein [Methanofollis sp.]